MSENYLTEDIHGTSSGRDPVGAEGDGIASVVGGSMIVVNNLNLICCISFTVDGSNEMPVAS